MYAKIESMLDEFYKTYYKIEEINLSQVIKCLTTTELHVIEAIGENSLTMNELSDKLGITMGTASVAVNKLTDKYFIERSRSEDDRRKVFVRLSKKGCWPINIMETFIPTFWKRLLLPFQKKNWTFLWKFSKL